MTDREKLIDIKNQIIEHLNQEEAEEPVTDEETEEPIEDEAPETEENEEELTGNPSDPLRGFKAEIIARGIIRCSWIPQAEGEIDIEFYEPEVDKEWKHSVNKYLKTLIPISAGSYRIWVREGESGEGYLFRAKKGDWVSEPVEAVYPKPEPKPEPVKEPEPVVDETEPEEKPEPTPSPTPVGEPKGDVQVALVFHQGHNIDIWLNGDKVPKESSFDYTFPSPAGDTKGVKLVWLTSDLKTFEFDPEQVNVDTFNYKMINRDRNSDLSKINANHDLENPDPDFWGQPASENPLGIIISRYGDTRYGTKYPYPLFYKGFPDDPVNDPDNLEIHPQWSINKKIVINLGV